MSLSGSSCCSILNILTLQCQGRPWCDWGMNPSSFTQTPEWCSPASSPPAAWQMASGFHCRPEPSQRLAAHTPSGAPVLQDTGCGNNVTRVLPLCLPKSGFVDCLFEGKEASDKHPVLKSCLGFVAEQGGELPLWQWGETEECWREVQHLRRTWGGSSHPFFMSSLSILSCRQWVGAIHPEGSCVLFSL